MTDQYSLGELVAECADYTVTVGINPAHLPSVYDAERALLEVSFLPVNRDLDRLWACARMRCGDLLFLSNWITVHRNAIAVNCVLEPCRSGQIRHTGDCFWKCLFDGTARDLRSATAALGPDETLCVTQLPLYSK